MGKTPKHYDKNLQPFDFIDEYQLDFYLGNVVKYIVRYRDKGTPEQDLKKAIHYLEVYKDRVIKDQRGLYNISSKKYNVKEDSLSKLDNFLDAWHLEEPLNDILKMISTINLNEIEVTDRLNIINNSLNVLNNFISKYLTGKK